MTAYYEEIMEIWREGKYFDAIRNFSRWMLKGLVAKDESKSFKKELARFLELAEVECEENTEVMFSLYEMLKRVRGWNDETFCRKLEISEKAIEDIKACRRPRSKAVGLRMLYELFPQMAV